MKNKRKEELKERKELALIKKIELKNQMQAIKILSGIIFLSLTIASIFSLKVIMIFVIIYLIIKKY